MFNTEKIRNEFFGLVGLRQTDNPDFPIISDKLIYTGNNILIQHPLLNIENIDMCARNYGQYNYLLWNMVTNYTVGDRVKYNDIVFESKTNNVGVQPDTNPLDWEEINLLSLYLEDVFLNSIDETVNSVLTKKKINSQAKTLLSNIRLTDGSGNINELIVNEGDLVGVQITLKRNQNIVAVINKIGLQLTLANPNINIYVYHSSQYNPITTLTLNQTKTISFEWHNVDIRLNYLSDLHDAGGTFYIMYDQNDLIGQAIKKRENFSTQPCSCNSTALQNYNLYNRYTTIKTCRVKSNKRNGINLWNIEQTEYLSDNNFGLNFEVTMRCDITDFIINQKDIFAFALRDMVIVKLLQNLSLSTRQNHLQTKVDQMARAELQDSKIGGMGLLQQLEKQLNAVDFELAELDSVCMPCNRKSGVVYSTAGLAR